MAAVGVQTEELVQTKRSFQEPNVPRRMYVFDYLI
jgi:hypothetical protein